MLARLPILVVAVCALSCSAHVAAFRPGESLSKDEAATLAAKSAPLPSGARVWGGLAKGQLGLVKWDSRSSADQSAPKELLQAVRDEVGRINQRDPGPVNVRLTLEILRYARRFGGRGAGEFTAVARNQRGQMVWALADSVQPDESERQTAAESDAEVAARSLGKRLRLGLGL